METNIIKAIINIANRPDHAILRNVNKGNNRVNNVGVNFEEYIKDVFADTIDEVDIVTRQEIFSTTFSYLGNKNSPPDIIIKNGDAIEVKKIENSLNNIALNSSYPKAKLLSSSKMITKACRECEEWSEKDIIYIIGTVKEDLLSSIFMIYGSDYAAEQGTYKRITDAITCGIKSVSNISFSETNEIARINNVDPLKITNLRVRGMWEIENPNKLFGHLDSVKEDAKSFKLVAIINNLKYYSFPKDYIIQIEKNQNIKIEDIKIMMPDNPAKLIDSKLITINY